MTGRAHRSDVTQQQAEAAAGVATVPAPVNPATRAQMSQPDGAPTVAARAGLVMHRGFDASHYQQTLDGAAARTAAEWAWLKSSEATGYKDPTYDRFSASCTAAGLPWGPYHFLRQAGRAADQAAWWKRCAGSPGHGGAVPMLDVEVDPMDEGFVDAMLAASDAAFGLTVAIYTYDGFVPPHPWLRKYHGRRPVVMARYATVPPRNAWDVWQDTDSFPLPGAGSHPDGDVTPDLTRVLIGAPAPQEDDMFDKPDRDLLDAVNQGIEAVVAALVPEDWDKNPATPSTSWLAERLAGLGQGVSDLTAAVKAGGVPVVFSDADFDRLAGLVADKLDAKIAARMAS